MVGINTNVSALNARLSLETNAVNQSQAMQRLSTGVRVNSAKDDAAALAISTGLISQTRGMTQAIRNVQDGISLAQTAESTVTSAINMVQRMRELALQSANGTLTDANRQALQLEFDSNINGINSALKASNFNGIKLFDGSASNIKIQTGVKAGETKTISIPGMTSLSLLGVAGTEFLNGGQTNPPPSIYTATTNQVYTSSNTNNYVDPVYIDPNLVVSGVGTIDGASVVMTNGDLGHDVLQLTNPPAGITATYDNTKGILKLSGTASIADYQDALRHVQFKTDATAAVGKRSFDINLGTALKGTNGHYYQYYDNNLDWLSAKKFADNTQLFGMTGYMVTITSQTEDNFVNSLINKSIWLGASDDYQQLNLAAGTTAYASQS
jgi:flagellin-like hook-associated protein FlgL